jgi:hypothetical protein
MIDLFTIAADVSSTNYSGLRWNFFNNSLKNTPLSSAWNTSWTGYAGNLVYLNDSGNIYPTSTKLSDVTAIINDGVRAYSQYATLSDDYADCAMKMIFAIPTGEQPVGVFSFIRNPHNDPNKAGYAYWLSGAQHMAHCYYITFPHSHADGDDAEENGGLFNHITDSDITSGKKQLVRVVVTLPHVTTIAGTQLVVRLLTARFNTETLVKTMFA